MKLLEGVEVRRIIGETQREIEGIAYHSKGVRKNYLFTALRGMETDGHHFIEEAVKKGATAILLEEEATPLASSTLIFVKNSREALAKISSAFYHHPSSRLRVIGITGTNGKTTTTYLLESIFKKAGENVGVIGTINYRYGDRVYPAPNTTPESLDLQRMLWEMKNEGVSCVILEVSSHGLEMGRVIGCQFDGALFTNLTQEHLDYHKTMDCYFESKRKLFSEFLIKSEKPKRFAVTNSDDPKGEEIVKGISLPIIRYGFHPSCDVSAHQIVASFEGLHCRIKTPRGEFPLNSQLIGRFNLYNLMAAVAAGIGADLPLETIREGLENVKAIRGRFEKVENSKGLQILIDYAHTPDALERALRALKEIKNNTKSEGKIITVFGCGGDRDRIKRPLMAEVAGKLSDLVILTSDNPRTEDPIAIIEEVEKGFHSIMLKELKANGIGTSRPEKGYLKIPDRRKAIRESIRLAQCSDIILIAGKGHEDYQIIGKERFPFDDRLEAQRALEEV
ncbi:MAG: UDP-N-acetylmuramoyl-L-alanyl-D-glutamate--2,6-diaminopimelate ligase [Thermodesulfobacteriota bacterium]